MYAEQLQRIRQALNLTPEQLARRMRPPISALLIRQLESGNARFRRHLRDAFRIFFGQMFRKIREKEGLSQAALAERVKLHRGTVAA